MKVIIGRKAKSVKWHTSNYICITQEMKDLKWKDDTDIIITREGKKIVIQNKKDM